MKLHDVKVYPSKAKLAREDQLAWKIAAVAADKVAVQRDIADDDHQPHHRQRGGRDRRDQPPPGGLRARHGAGPRAQGRRPPCSACRPATPRQPGMGGLGERHGGARARHARHLPRRRLLPSRRQHPADPGGGADHGEVRPRPIRGIATGYEIHIDLVRAICLHEHKIDHIAHLCPAQAAGIGTLLGLPSRRSTRRCSRPCM